MLKRWLFLILILAGLAAQPVLAADKYYVPPTQFNAAFQVMDLGFANIFGLFQNATGGFTFDDANKTISAVKIGIDTNSLMTANNENKRDLSLLFGAQQFPEVAFAALAEAKFKDGKAEIKGTLTLHGISKPATFEATLNHTGASPRGAGMWRSEAQAVGLSLRGSFKRADFGMGDEPEVPGRFGDTVTLMLEMQGIRQ
jgi:polyisoprenoid-binding protein YceI